MSQITFRQLANIGRYYQKQFTKKRYTNRDWTLMLAARIHNQDRIYCWICGNPNLYELLVHHKRYEKSYYSKFGMDIIASDVYHQELKDEMMNDKLTEKDIEIVCKYCHKDIDCYQGEIMLNVKTQDEQYANRKSNKLSQLLYMIPFWWGENYSLYDLQNKLRLLITVCNTIVGDKKNNFKSWEYNDDYIILSKRDFLENDLLGKGLDDFFWN
jgi:hypothetical protein